MLGNEGEHVEFKRLAGSSTIKAVISFLNSGGGVVYIGVDDDGSNLGVDNIDAEITRLTSMMSDLIKPDALMSMSCGVECVDGRDVIVIRVQRGVKRPYYLASKGPRPEGVFVRGGAASVPASETAILRMIQETEGDSFESRPSTRQDLTFEFARNEFARKTLALGEGELRTLGAMLPNGTYSNLGLLLSDQCPPTIKTALFADDDRNAFTAREEYSGSILQQLSGAYAFLERNNHFRTSYDGLERIDHHDIPPIALREALVNSVAHREYALTGPTLVSVMPRGVEITSPGGLPLGIEEADLGAHISIPRNKMLANVLFRLELIEVYGTGIGRMRSSYRGTGLMPSIRLTPNTFTVLLPNRNSHPEASNQNAGTGSALIGIETDSTRKTPSTYASGNASAGRHAQAARLFELLANGPLSRRQLQDALGLTQPTAIRLLGKLATEGLIERHGNGRATQYSLAEHAPAENVSRHKRTSNTA